MYIVHRVGIRTEPPFVSFPDLGIPRSSRDRWLEHRVKYRRLGQGERSIFSEQTPFRTG